MPIRLFKSLILHSFPIFNYFCIHAVPIYNWYTVNLKTIELQHLKRVLFHSLFQLIRVVCVAREELPNRLFYIPIYFPLTYH